jgi:phage terminase Nu1 subunit (DNA packaging protein)
MTELLNRAQVSAILDVEPRSLSRYASGDDPLKPIKAAAGKPSLYDATEVGQWLIRRELRALQRAAGDEDPLDYNRERCRLVKAQADSQELKNAQRRREVADVQLLTWALAKTCGAVVATLDTLPSKLKRSMPSLTASEIEVARREIAYCCNQIAKTEIDWSDAPKVDE